MQKTTERSALLSSGICTKDDRIVLGQGGNIVTLPFWKNLKGSASVMSDTNPANIKKIDAGKDLACIHFRWQAWSANDLASILAGDNAMNAIGNKVADFWASDMQNVLVHTLKGAFSASSMTESVLDISDESGDAGIISAESILDAMYLLGDAYSSLTGIMMHSMVMKKLAKLNLIDYVPDSEGKVVLPTYMGKTVIVDDSLVAEDATEDDAGTKYPIYFFGAGAVAFNEGTSVRQVETDRDTIAGDDLLITRRQFTMHPRGISWNGGVPDVSPELNALATGSNWLLTEEKKNVAITKLIARVS